MFFLSLLCSGGLTLWGEFDFMGAIKKKSLKLRKRISQKLVLKGVDGVVFVANSQATCTEENIKSLQHLKDLLKEEGLGLDQIPMVFQYNKRDLDAIEPLSSMRGKLNLYNHPDFSACALKGEGVFDTLKTLSKMVITVLKGGKLK